MKLAKWEDDLVERLLANSRRLKMSMTNYEIEDELKRLEGVMKDLRHLQVHDMQKRLALEDRVEELEQAAEVTYSLIRRLTDALEDHRRKIKGD